MKLFLSVFAAFFALAFSLQPASAIVSGHPLMAERLHSDYQYDLLVAFFAIVCSALLRALVVHYYRIQWGRKSVMTR
jgi:hypothetical protein